MRATKTPLIPAIQSEKATAPDDHVVTVARVRMAPAIVHA